MAPSKNTEHGGETVKARRMNEMGRRPVKVANCSGYAGESPSKCIND
jgi:hypothetical protein